MPGSVMGNDPPNPNTDVQDGHLDLPANVTFRQLGQIEEKFRSYDAMLSQLTLDRDDREKRLTEKVSNLQDAIIVYENRFRTMADLEVRLRTMEQHQESSHSSPRTHEPKVADPPMFNGNRESLVPFLSKCQLKFDVQSSTFNNERIKVMYAASRLEGPAFAWFSPLNDKLKDVAQMDPPELESFESFSSNLTLLYGDPNLYQNAERKLRRLRQNTTVSAYIQEFEKLRQYVTWNESALRATFYDGLWGPVKDLMIANGAPTELTALKDLALRIDARMEGRKVEKQSYAPKSAAISSGTQNQPKGSSSSSSGRPATAWNPTPSAPRPTTSAASPAPGQPTSSSTPRANFPSHTADGTVPMELGTRGPRGPLTDAQKIYRRKHNLCLYCGIPDHTVATCHSLKAHQSSAAHRTTAFNIDITEPMPEDFTDGESGSENYSPRE